ncbi:MAG TPA: HD domain-containing protein [Planctomycetes bacterium]|nr:HD domain-containing protein [Planctomycetota bacterium]
MDATFEVVQGGVPGQRFLLTEGERRVIGRANDSDFQLLDRGVSRHHAVVYFDREQVVVEDLGSSNGTYVNGQRVKRSIVNAGDLVRIGLAALRVHSGISIPDVPTPRPVDDELLDREAAAFATRVRKHLDIERSFILSPPRDDELAGLRRAHRNLAALYRLSSDIHAAQDTRTLFTHVVDILRESLDADAVALILATSGGGTSLAALKVRENTASESFSISNSVVEDVVSTAVSTLVHDTGIHSAPAGASIIAQQIRSIICAPVVAGGATLGAVYADSRRNNRVFDEVDLELITAAGKQAGLAIQRARLFRDMENLFFSSIRALSSAVDAKDRYTRGHSERVTAYAVRLARHIGLDEQEVETVQLAGLLHDIGKIAVPESILNKPGPLVDEEYALVKEHPSRGAEIVSTIKSPNIPAVVQGVLHHHERWDGSGYPDGLKGFDTPLTARILSLADAFDAMTSDRPYRRGYSIEHAVSLIGEAGGTQFDTELAGHFLELYYAGRLELPSRKAAQYDTSRITLDGEENGR